MKEAIVPVLTVSGSDSINGAGVQADIRTISVLGGIAHTVITAITAQNSQGIESIYDLPSDIVTGQLDAVLKDMRPKAVKIGMVHQREVMKVLGSRLSPGRAVVCAPGILSSKGESLMSDSTLEDYVRLIFPMVDVLVIKCSEAEKILHAPVQSQEEMLLAAQALLDKGVRAVLLRGGHCSRNMVTGLLLTADGRSGAQFFSSPNTEGWQIHGIGGTMSSAIATRLAMGDSIPQAIKAAHHYIRCQIVYSVGSANQSIRQIDLYNRLMEMVAQHCKSRRDTAFYASELSVTPRYLAMVTDRVAGKSPKQLITDYIMQEVERVLLSSTRSIQEVSDEFGFRSQAAFAKFFRAQKGCSPTDFRNG